MRIAIDAEKCQGHNRCYALAPELVDVDDMGMALVRNDGLVPDGLEEKARLLVANCPEYAITLSEDLTDRSSTGPTGINAGLDSGAAA